MENLHNLLAKAQLLISEDPNAAMTLLADGRAGVQAVPQAYDVVLSRAALAAGKSELALEYVCRALRNNDTSAVLRRVHAEVLLDLGNIIDAGEQLNLAVAAGVPIENLPTSLKLVLQNYVCRAHPLSEAAEALNVRVVAEFGVLDEAKKVLFIYCPKVACTVLKATVVMNSPQRDIYLAEGKPIHNFVGQHRDENKLIDAMTAQDVFRFTVLREPSARILSAYLNKFVPDQPDRFSDLARHKRYAIRVGQRLAGIEANAERGITFEEFVHFLVQADDLEMDVHWMPQCRIVGANLERYNFVGRFESLSKTFEMLEQTFGYVPERDSSVHLNGQKDHATKHDASVSLDRPYQRSPAELSRLGSIFPRPDAFLTPELRSILVKRYARDAEMHATT